MFPSQISARLALAPHGCANAAAARRITQSHQELVILPTGHKPHMWNCVQLLLDVPGFHRINGARGLAHGLESRAMQDALYHCISTFASGASCQVYEKS